MLNESELKKHLNEGRFKTLYLVFGEEKMLVRRCTDLILKKISGGDLNDFNYHAFGDEADIAGISVAADIIPFMSERNIVKITDLNADKLSADDFKSLMKVLEHLPDTTTVILTMPTLELTSKTAKAQFKKLITLADKSGVCMELAHRSGIALERDLCKWAKAGGCTMTELTAHKLIEYVGEDLNRLNLEMKKLTAYANGDEITPETIDLLVHKNTEASVYDLFGYIVAGDTNRMMIALSVLFYEQMSGMAICSALANAYLDAYRARVGAEAGKSSADIAADFGYRNRAWVLDKIKRQISRVTTVSLRRSIDAIVTAQNRLLSEPVDEKIEVERLACELVLIAEDRADG